jgi:hypothetical protein
VLALVQVQVQASLQLGQRRGTSSVGRLVKVLLDPRLCDALCQAKPRQDQQKVRAAVALCVVRACRSL